MTQWAVKERVKERIEQSGSTRKRTSKHEILPPAHVVRLGSKIGLSPIHNPTRIINGAIHSSCKQLWRENNKMRNIHTSAGMRSRHVESEAAISPSGRAVRISCTTSAASRKGSTCCASTAMGSARSADEEDGEGAAAAAEGESIGGADDADDAAATHVGLCDSQSALWQ